MDFRQNDNMVRVGLVVSSCGKAQPGPLCAAHRLPGSSCPVLCRPREHRPLAHWLSAHHTGPLVLFALSAPGPGCPGLPLTPRTSVRSPGPWASALHACGQAAQGVTGPPVDGRPRPARALAAAAHAPQLREGGPVSRWTLTGREHVALTTASLSPESKRRSAEPPRGTRSKHAAPQGSLLCLKQSRPPGDGNPPHAQARPGSPGPPPGARPHCGTPARGPRLAQSVTPAAHLPAAGCFATRLCSRGPGPPLAASHSWLWSGLPGTEVRLEVPCVLTSPRPASISPDRTSAPGAGPALLADLGGQGAPALS